jgi:hypothetical protein
MTRVPCQKGTSVLPVILALKQRPDAKRLVPEPLWKYFDEHLVVGGWYPERDYWVLIEALVKAIDPKLVGGDVWRYFAKFSAQTDIAGGAKKATGPAGSAGAGSQGVYRNFAAVDAHDAEAFFRRVIRLWSQYHDTGAMQIRGGRAISNSLFMRLVGFHIPIEGFVRLQGYYVEEFGRVVGLALESRVKRSTASGDLLCEWEILMERTPRSEAYIASLPPVQV